MRSKAAWRLRDCDRDSDAAARTVGPYRLSRRARCLGPKVDEFATSNWTSTRLNVRLACWPPGPPDVVARQLNSLMGIASALCTRSVDPGLGTGSVSPAELAASRSDSSNATARERRTTLDHRVQSRP